MKTSVLATIGSVFLAIAASACCWLPMLLLATGVSAAGAGSFLGPLRPFLLGFAVVLLAIGLYVSYRPRGVECGPDRSCSAPRQPWLQRFGRYGLWFSLLLVAASALMPRYAGGFRHASTNSVQSSTATDTLVLGVAGMSCAGCEPAVEEALSRVPGVVAAKVSYDTKHATVTVARASSPSQLALVTAVHAAGYEITPASGTPEPPSLAGHWTGDVHLDSTQTPKMILDLDQLGSRWVGEFDVAEFGVENYPIKIEFANGRVKLGFSAAEADFEGTLSADGNHLTGVLAFEDQKFKVVFERSGKPEFSGSFLEFEGAADDSSRVEKLSPTGAELQRRFNADRSKVRLLMLLAPT